MDTNFSNTLHSIANKEGVKGVLIADEMGLCLGVRGIAKPENAPFITSIANASRSLQEQHALENKAEYPTVTVDYDNMKIAIKPGGSFTVAIFL
ncbi:unnamed protein product [Cunninghamella blakesleeana]